MKQRMSILDIRAMANELNARLSNAFIQNFYSFEQRFIYVKFSNKDILLIEPGVRIHLCSDYETEISHFCKKLREKCRHAKVHEIYQFGFDRVIVINTLRFRLVIEFYSGGNIVILDENDTIIDLLRTVKELGIEKNSKYIFNKVEIDTSFEKFKEMELSEIFPFEKEYIDIIKGEMDELAKRLGVDFKGLKDERCRSNVEDYFRNLKDQIDNIGGFGEVTLLKNKPEMLFSFKTVFDPNKVEKVDRKLEISEKLKSLEIKNLQEISEETVKNNNQEEGDAEEIKDSQKISDEEKKTEDEKIKQQRYKINLCDKGEIEDILSKSRGIKALVFSSLSEASEYYFFDTKKQKKLKENKGIRIKKAQERYIQELGLQAEGTQEIIDILVRNRELLESILSVFKKVFETRMEWKDFDIFWEQERLNKNPLASAIKSYDLRKRTCIVELESSCFDLDLNLNLSKNIEKFYLKKKKSIDKSVKTQNALENIAEKMIPKKESVKIQKREPFWFEKFHFFISSGGKLVIGGKNSQQNEVVVKKHLDPSDLYFHCDVQGASSVICKGRDEDTVTQASYMSLCMSKCWEEGVIRQVFYVEPDQVSKAPPTGEFISKGGFMIRGKKNILNPYRLEYGVGLLFKKEDSAEILDFCTVPESGHAYQYAFPVCAPWIVVKDYKYRIRLCPGNEKKSKICQDILKTFHNVSKDSSEERAVKAIGVDEYMSVVLGKSKIAKIIK